MEDYKKLNELRAIGIRHLRCEEDYDFPVFDEDFGEFLAILDYKGWGNKNLICLFTLETGRKLKITAYRNKYGYSAQKGDYDFSNSNNLGKIFKINIGKTKSGNTKFISGTLIEMNEEEEINLVNKIIVNEENYKKPFGKEYWDKIVDNQKLELEFFESCKKGNLEMVKYFLIERNIDINSSDFNGGSSGLRLATSNNHFEVVKYLLESNELKEHADFNLSDDWSSNPSFRIACRNDNREIIKYFIDNFKIEMEVIKKTIKNAFLSSNKNLLFFIIDSLELDRKEEVKECVEKYRNYEDIEEEFLNEMIKFSQE